MPEPVTTDSEDFAALMAQPDTPPAKEPEKVPEPVAEVPATPEPETAAPVKTEPEEEPGWNKALQKTQQQVRSLLDAQKERDAALDKRLAKLDKLAALSGVEDEPTPTPAPQTVPEPSEVQQELARVKRDLEFIKIRQSNPEADPEAMWDKAFDEALELFEIDKEATTLPNGITPEAVTRAANRFFHQKVDAFKPKKAAAAPTPTPPRRLPPKTPGGAGVSPAPASPVVAPRVPTARDTFIEDCRELMGMD